MLSASELKMLAERIAQLSDNHRRLSEALKNFVGSREERKEKEHISVTPPVKPPNVFPLSNFSEVKKDIV